MKGIVTLEEYCTRIDLLDPDEHLDRALGELRSTAAEGSRAVAGLIRELLECRSPKLGGVLYVAQKLQPTPELLDAVRAVIAAPSLASQPPRAGFDPDIAGGGKIGWDDGRAAGIKTVAEKALRELGGGAPAQESMPLAATEPQQSEAARGYLPPEHKRCTSCGATIKSAAVICPQCGVPQRRPVSKPTLLLLTFFTGGIGGHKFYLGKNWLGVLYMLFCWTYIPGLVAMVEFLVYAFTSSERLNEKYSANASAATIVAVVVGFVVVIGVLAAISLPAYQDYTVRAKVSDGLIRSEPLKDAIVESFRSRGLGDMSCSASACAIGVELPRDSHNVRSVASDKQGVITITYEPNVSAASKNVLTLTPQIDGANADLSRAGNAGKAVSWKCGGGATTIPPKFLPAICR